MEKSAILTANVLDIIFDNRNKLYGAYDLRKTYNNRVFIALGITFSFILLVAIGNLVAGNKRTSNFSIRHNEIVEMKNLEEKEQPKLPETPPPAAKPQPQVKTIAFVPPIIVDDNKVTNPPPATDELAHVKIDIVTKEGIDNDGLTRVESLDGDKGIIIEKKIEKEEPETIYTSVQIEASYPDGNAAWAKFLQRNLNGDVPVNHDAPPGTYKVIIQFIVDKNGQVSNIVPLTNMGYGMEEEAMRVLRKSGQWTPAQQNGVMVTAYRKQPITFVINGE